MSVFGGMSKGERNRIKIRVRTAMEAQAKIEGRFLGGRPPYGYRLADAGPAPQPGQGRGRQARLPPGTRPRGGARRAPDLRRVPQRRQGHLRHRREADPRGHPVPLGARPRPEPAPLRHRLDQVRGPRDPGQPALHRPPGLEQAAQGRGPARRATTSPSATPPNCDGTRLASGFGPSRSCTRRSSTEPPSIRSRRSRLGGASKPAEHKPHGRADRTRCAAACAVASASGGCKATGPTSAPYYRCRFPAEYALANRVEHPLNVCLREDAILAEVDGWLAREFAPHRLRQTIADLAAVQEARRFARDRPRGDEAADRRRATASWPSTAPP